KAADDASTTVQRLQRFARQRGSAVGEMSDINQIVQDVIEMTRPSWRDAAQREGRYIELRTDFGEVPRIMVEQSGLREVLVNMVYNALNAMPKGGEITISTRAVPPYHVEISVADNGVGMTPEVAARVFDPFFTTRGVEGTGLGLAVSWTIIQKHGGMITVDTSPGKGSRFVIRLPMRQAEAAGLPIGPAPAQEAPQQGSSILVVDDEPFVAGVLDTILTRQGHRVQVAHSAEEALQILRGDARFDLVLTDHGMPGKNGLQLSKEVKSTWPGLPVVLLTGWGETLMQAYSEEPAPDAVIAKPINQSDLLEVIHRTLRDARSAQ
ncbi:MAG TPA: ATP-binding protein, partial [Chthonomonadales bacterium]|nr:ATP-binding protein [Chthonomonadales bacterium]